MRMPQALLDFNRKTQADNLTLPDEDAAVVYTPKSGSTDDSRGGSTSARKKLTDYDPQLNDDDEPNRLGYRLQTFMPSSGSQLTGEKPTEVNLYTVVLPHDAVVPQNAQIRLVDRNPVRVFEVLQVGDVNERMTLHVTVKELA